MALNIPTKKKRKYLNLYIWSEPILVVGLRSTAKNGDKEDRGGIPGPEQAKSVDVVEPNKLNNLLIQSKIISLLIFAMM